MAGGTAMTRPLPSGFPAKPPETNASVILLNKTDLVPADELAQVGTRIRSINATAVIHRTQRCEVGLDMVLGRRSVNGGAVELLLVLANATGVVMLVAGLLSQGPVPFAGKRLEEPVGVHRITRHPVFMCTSAMAIAHAVANG